MDINEAMMSFRENLTIEVLKHAYYTRSYFYKPEPINEDMFMIEPGIYSKAETKQDNYVKALHIHSVRVTPVVIERTFLSAFKYLKIGKFKEEIFGMNDVLFDLMLQTFQQSDVNYSRKLSLFFITKIKINDEKPSYLVSDGPRPIVISKSYDYWSNFRDFIDENSIKSSVVWNFEDNTIYIRIPDESLAKFYVKNL